MSLSLANSSHSIPTFSAREPVVGLIEDIPTAVRHVATHHRGTSVAFHAFAQRAQHLGAQIAAGLRREADVKFAREIAEQGMLGIGRNIQRHVARPGGNSQLNRGANQKRGDLRGSLRTVIRLQAGLDLAGYRLLGKKNQLRLAHKCSPTPLRSVRLVIRAVALLRFAPFVLSSWETSVPTREARGRNTEPV